jgi:hypothetical protein
MAGEELHLEGRRVGSVLKKSIWRGDAVADLPGLSLPVAVFVVAVVLTMWDSAKIPRAPVAAQPP